jgi:ADP-ribose pyrophosphatase YjhB (NUDIX family)
MEPGDRPLPADRHVFRYCPQCRTGMTRRVDGGSERPACPACGLVQYLNPAPAAGIVLLREGRVCLVKRRYEPKQGQWSLPSGFMEWDEAPSFTAQREALEETGLEVELDGLYAVEQGLLPPDTPVVVVFYLAREVGGRLVAGDDAEEAGFYALDALPGPLAFAAHRRVLARLAEDLREHGRPLGARVRP